MTTEQNAMNFYDGEGRLITSLPATGSLKVLAQTYVLCPKHGRHTHTINSTIPGHEGTWCQICWLESLGTPLPTERDEA